MQSEPRHARTSVWAPPVSLAATSSIDVSFFSSGYLDVSVHRVPFHTLCIGVRIHEVHSCGFPHSEICGSMDMCSFPQLIAAYHVFHRLLVPRHPPCALLRFAIALTFISAFPSYLAWYDWLRVVFTLIFRSVYCEHLITSVISCSFDTLKITFIIFGASDVLEYMFDLYAVFKVRTR